MAETTKPTIKSRGKLTSKRDERAPARLTFAQQKRLDGLPAEIERLEIEIAKLEGLLGDPDLFAREPVKFAKASAALEQRQQRLSGAEEEWLELEGLREAIG